MQGLESTSCSCSGSGPSSQPPHSSSQLSVTAVQWDLTPLGLPGRCQAPYTWRHKHGLFFFYKTSTPRPVNGLEQPGQKLTFLKLSDLSDLPSISQVSDAVLICPVPMEAETQRTGQQETHLRLAAHGFESGWTSDVSGPFLPHDFSTYCC